MKVSLLIVGVLALMATAAAFGPLYNGYTFEQFLAQHKDLSLLTSNTYDVAYRRSVFEKNLETIRAQNRLSSPWYMTVNQFADMTEEEFVAKYTGNNVGKTAKFRNPKRNGCPAAGVSTVDPKVAFGASDFDWRNEPNVVSPVKNQGGCGSCWAYAAVQTFESHAYLATGKAAILSTQQATSCTPNPHHCGGSGGCEGATAELAFEYIAGAGITSFSSYPDTSASTGKTGQCVAQGKPLVFTSKGYKSITPNNATAHFEGLQKGPLSVSVAANALMFYGGGIFSGCDMKKNVEINHAVVMVGYGVENGKSYWTIRNSWGTGWGEKGYFRLARYEEEPCGIDSTPESGSACEGEHDPIKVCGMCGILAESSYPTGIALA